MSLWTALNPGKAESWGCSALKKLSQKTLKSQFLIFIGSTSYENKRKLCWKGQLFLLDCRRCSAQWGWKSSEVPRKVSCWRNVGLGKRRLCNFLFQVSFLDNYSHSGGGQAFHLDKALCSCSVVEILFIISLEGALGCSESLFPQIIFNLSLAQLGRADKPPCP